MNSAIILSDYLEGLKREIRALREQLAELLQEREELLSHICPQLQAQYAAVIGVYENRAHYLELQILELKRRIEIVQAAINRAKTISSDKVDEQIHKEYQTFHERVEQERRRAEKAQKAQQAKEEKEQEYQKAWEHKYGHTDMPPSDGESANGTDGKDTSEKTESEHDRDRNNDNTSEKETSEGKQKVPNAKDLYRKIVKRLHPDVNPNATEHEKELFRKATKAYQEGDIVTLQEIYNEIFSGVNQEENEGDVTIEKLEEIRRILRKQIQAMEEEIRGIQNRTPYKYKELLEDPEKIRLVQEKIQEAISLYEKEIERLQKLYREACRQMSEQAVGSE